MCGESFEKIKKINTSPFPLHKAKSRSAAVAPAGACSCGGGYINATGELRANGGNGADSAVEVGGGAAGGRIKLYYGPLSSVDAVTVELLGGAGGISDVPDQYGGDPGGNGVYFLAQLDYPIQSNVDEEKIL